MILPTLFKKTSTGAIQFWTIEHRPCVRKYPDGSLESLPGLIVTTYGQVGTDSPQVTEDIIRTGKNIGRKNETSVGDQAAAEATAKWEKQKKKGYVISVEAAEADELDAVIEGGIVPMLAHSYDDHAKKIKFPAFIQPKLDGIRCIAILKDGVCTLWTRTRKPITSVPHINRAVEARFKEDITVDGELYNHEMKAEFEKIVSLVRQEEPAEGHEQVLYWIYDTVNEDPFSKRTAKLYESYRHIAVWDSPDRLVPNYQVESDEDIKHYAKVMIRDGYEGVMVRNMESKYVNKRSYDLLKVKEFLDAEFEIVGAEEGRGKLAGHVGAFVCKTDNGKQFLAKMDGKTERLKEYFENPATYLGKKITVKYQGLTGANGVPRFPVGVAIRDYE